GYTKAFSKMFGKTPGDYKNNKAMIPLFISYPVNHSYEHYYKKGENKLSNDTIVCTTYVVSRPKRKMIILRSQKANDYFSFCEEAGCDWEGYLNSNPNKLDTAAVLTLPARLIKQATGKIAAGIEIPFNCKTENLPDSDEVIELDSCELAYFKSQSFENDDNYCKYIDAVNKAFDEFDFQSIGYELDLNAAPSMNFGAQQETGAKIAYPVRKIKAFR
ncbi:MAG: AraC family transcriptional regulator, partial [Eubacterium sp.]